MEKQPTEFNAWIIIVGLCDIKHDIQHSDILLGFLGFFHQEIRVFQSLSSRIRVFQKIT